MLSNKRLRFLNQAIPLLQGAYCCFIIFFFFFLNTYLLLIIHSAKQNIQDHTQHLRFNYVQPQIVLTSLSKTSLCVCFLCDLTQAFNQTYCRSSGVKQTGFNWIAECWTMTFPKRLDHLSSNSKSGQFRFTRLHGQWLTKRGRYQHSMRHAGATSTCKSKTCIAEDKRRFGIEIDNNFLFISLYILISLYVMIVSLGLLQQFIYVPY